MVLQKRFSFFDRMIPPPCSTGYSWDGGLRFTNSSYFKSAFPKFLMQVLPDKLINIRRKLYFLLQGLDRKRRGNTAMFNLRAKKWCCIDSCSDSPARLPGFKSWFSHLAAVWPQAGNLTFWLLNLLTCKTRIKIISTSKDVCEASKHEPNPWLISSMHNTD